MSLLLSLGMTFILGNASPSMALSWSDLDGNAYIRNPVTNQPLGVVSSNRYDDNSICNPYGDYGSKYSDISIMDKYGDYGSKYSNFSAYNSQAEYPPLLYWIDNHQPIAVISVSSKWGEDSIHPGALFGTICGQR